MTMTSEKTPTRHKAKRHYWLREDFKELMSVLRIDGHEFPGDRKSSASLTYPKNIEGAFRELRLRGLECDAATLMELVEKRIVLPKGDMSNLEWSEEDIDAAAEWLNESQRWGPWTHFCWVANLRYGQAVQAHRYMCARHGLGFSMSFDALGVVTVIEPAENPDDYARVRFYPKGTKVEASQ